MKIIYFLFFAILIVFACKKKETPIKKTELKVGFESSKTNIVELDTIQFNNLTTSSENNITYKWFFPGGEPNQSFEKNPKIKYLKEGNYDVKLVAYASNKKDSVESKLLISVTKVPLGNLKVDFISSKTSIFESDTIQFNNLTTSSENNITYKWTFQGGEPNQSTEKSPKIKYLKEGSYDVKLVAFITGKKDSVESKLLIKVSKLPIINLDASFQSSKTSIFESDIIQFNNLTTSSESNITYKWTFQGGEPSQSSEKNPKIKYLKEGSYDVKLVAYAANKKDSVESKRLVQVKINNVIVTQGLLLYYPFNGNAKDESGNSINGLVGSSATLTSGKAGNPNTAYHFNGSFDSYINIPTTKLQIDTFSYFMRIYLDEIPSYGGQYMPFSIGSIGGDQHFQAMNNVFDGHGWAFGGYSKNEQALFKPSGISIEAKRWYSVVVTRTNHKMNLYVDCNLVAEDSSIAAKVAFYGLYSVIARLGSRYDGALPLKGKIDEFRIYNRVLSPSEVCQLSNDVVLQQ